MEILMNIGFWILVFIYLAFIHIMLLSLAAMLIAIPGRYFGLGGSELVIGINMGAAIGLYTSYNYLWLLSFGEQAPIVFYILGLIASWFGSGTDEVQANLGNKLMTSGEVVGIFICIGIALWNGASFF